MAEELGLNLTGNLGGELPPIQMTPDLQAAMNTDPMSSDTLGGTEPPGGLTVEQIAGFLKVAYQAHGIGTTFFAQRMYPGAPSFMDIWQEDDQFYLEVATGIAPNVIAWCERFPAAEYAVKAANATGFWGRLAWSYFSRWAFTYLRFRQLKIDAQQEAPSRHEEPSRYTNPATQQPASQPASMGSPAASGPIIDYRPATASEPTVAVQQPVAAAGPGADPYRVDYTPRVGP